MIQIAAPPDSNMWARRRSEAVQKAATTKVCQSKVNDPTDLQSTLWPSLYLYFVAS